MKDDCLREVKFNWYCNLCVHQDKKGHEQPCNACLDNPLNYYTERPVKFEKKEKKDVKQVNLFSSPQEVGSEKR